MTEPESYEIKRIADKDEVSGFDCGEEPWHKEVSDFLTEDALDQQTLGLNTTLLFYMDESLIGFASLLASSIKLEDEPTLSAKSGLMGIGYQEFPCVKIGQFGVDRAYQGQGIGGFMLSWVRGAVIEGAVGVRFLSLHVHRKNKQGRDFWHRSGFQRVKNLSGSKYVFMLHDLYASGE